MATEVVRGLRSPMTWVVNDAAVVRMALDLYVWVGDKTAVPSTPI